MNTREEKINEIIDMVVNDYGLDRESIKIKTKKIKIVEPRQVVHYLAKNEIEGASYQFIADHTGLKEHSTVINSIKEIENKMFRDIEFKVQIENYFKKLKNKKFELIRMGFAEDYKKAKTLVTMRAASKRNNTAYVSLNSFI